MRRYLLTLLLSAPGAALAAPCAVPTFDPAPAAVQGGTPRQLRADDPICPKAIRALGHFRRMARAIGREPGEDIHFQIRMSREDNGYHSGRYDMVSLSEGLLRGSTEDEMVLVISHEMGHAKQDHDRVRVWGTQREGHADALGAQILIRAGYDHDLARRGREARLGCSRITAADQGQPNDHPLAAARWQNVVAMTAAHVSMRDGLAAARSFDGRGRSVPWVGIDDVSADGVVRPGALVRRTLTVQAARKLGAPELTVRAPGERVPDGRVVVSDVPVPFSGGRRATVTRPILNPVEYFAAIEHNRAVREAASRLDAFTSPGATAARLTGRLCGIDDLDYRSLTAMLRDGAVATARALRPQERRR